VGKVLHRLFGLGICVALLACGAAIQPETVSLPIPFGGALDGSSRTIVSDGSAVVPEAFSKFQSALASCSTFFVFDSNGVPVGTCSFCPSTAIQSENVALGRQDTFEMPVSCSVDQVDSVTGTLKFFEYPHQDPTLTDRIPELLPDEDPNTVEIRKGICSGVITNGFGAYFTAIGNATMDCKYVAFTRVGTPQKEFLYMLENVWILHR